MADGMIYVYRFRDLVAFSAIRTDKEAQGDTIYMSAHQARGVTEALLKVVRSIDKERFTDSKIGTILIDPTGPVLGGMA